MTFPDMPMIMTVLSKETLMDLRLSFQQQVDSHTTNIAMQPGAVAVLLDMADRFLEAHEFAGSEKTQTLFMLSMLGFDTSGLGGLSLEQLRGIRAHCQSLLKDEMATLIDTPPTSTPQPREDAFRYLHQMERLRTSLQKVITVLNNDGLDAAEEEFLKLVHTKLCLE